MNTEYHLLNWQFCRKNPNDLYRTFLSGTYTVNGKEFTFKYAMIMCIVERDGDVIFSVINPENGYGLDVHGKFFVGTIREVHYEYRGDDPHSSTVLFDHGGLTMNWNPETQKPEAIPTVPDNMTRDQRDLDWMRQIAYDNYYLHHK